MNRKIILGILAATLTASTLFAQESTPLSGLDDWVGYKTNLTKKDGGIIEAKGQSLLRSTKILDFSPDKKYYISGEFRSSVDGEEAKIFFGFFTLDKNGKTFDCAQVNALPGTDTEISADAQKGSLEIKVKDASKWMTQGSTIIYNTDPSYSDLPNYNQLTNALESITSSGDVWTIKLKTPLQLDLAIGTKVRLHIPGGAMYTAASNKKLNGEWQKFSGFAAGILNKPGLNNPSISYRNKQGTNSSFSQSRQQKCRN